MKIKCIKLDCPVCNKSGSCQLFHNKQGQLRYARVRHYSHIDKDSKRLKFTYHKINDLSVVKTLLENLGYQFRTAKQQDGQSNNSVTKVS